MSEKINIFHPNSPKAWREWLVKNHENTEAVWLVFHTVKSGKPSLTWSEAVDEALCFGWIDSKKVKIDTDTYHQYFSKRKANSTWSKVNKDKILQLEAENRMEKAGWQVIERAKENGSWTLLDSVEALLVPDKLVVEFNKYEGASDYFESLSKSSKKILLSWIVLAKREETKMKRIQVIAEAAGQQSMPKPFQ
ncbi:Uncharacterized conserved protein YdeI, YjbR/CyaY-like superfamily, DUF1801 family [Lishizhenia tianjinensis]|uniref:Uncharacterized conserved protein YdeI, YjbR/CyaY-like superfamily, DUF1801 family n=1 Tax=Lishizhenia tianjinensis TaxID=477690 RepID=A0A1I6XAE3_9FLAO|nr:YdeI/OmpD-associated family protein [Lishizhenia tianjinensis]SFT35106.1 Uncharacterized conserved protein YdeI, YjbR/CyaY-like superfamily, DUF1801 family [Lishizhenia tianjinensis]